MYFTVIFGWRVLHFLAITYGQTLKCNRLERLQFASSGEIRTIAIKKHITLSN